jgi:saccharopine dehydrogenase-like NADP-dependent oxidoreductase
MNKRVLVFGAGLVTGPLVEYLLARGYTVTIACRTPAKGQSLAGQHSHASVIEFDIARDEARIDGLLDGCDLAVSMLPYIHHVTLARRCVAKRKPLVTTSYVSDAMRALDGAARDAGIVLLNEVGLDPGIDHMSAMSIIDRVKAEGGRVASFSSYCGGLPAPEANTNPLGYKFSWSPRGVLLASRNSACFLRDGRQVDIPGAALFSNYNMVEIAGLGAFEGYPNRSSLPYLELYGITGASGMFRGTLRNAGWCDALKAMADLGLLDDALSDWSGRTHLDMLTRRLPAGSAAEARQAVASFLGLPVTAHPVKVLEWLGLFDSTHLDQVSTSPLDILVGIMLSKMSYAPGERDMVILRHEFIAESATKRELITSTLVDYGIPNGQSSMSRTVGIPAAIAISLILEGKVQAKGVQIPVTREWYAPILSELERLGIRFVETSSSI